MNYFKKLITIYQRPHYRIAIIYFAISFMWIIYTDEITYRLFQDPSDYKIVESIKSEIFVFATAILIFLLIKSSYRTIKIKNEELIENQTQLKFAYDALKQSEEKFRKIVEGAPEPLFIHTDNAFSYLNPAFCSLLGTDSPDEIINRPVLEKFHLEDHQKVLLRIKHAKEHKITPYNLPEVRIIKLDGTIIWVETTSEPIEYEGKEGTLVFVKDVTSRKETEDKLRSTQDQLRLLFANLDNIREEERKTIARELHDELGQVLTSLNMNLSLLKNNVKNGMFNETQLLSELNEMSHIIDDSKKNIKELIRSLRPEYLDNLGLIPALTFLVEEFKNNSEINVEFIHNFEEIEMGSHKENIIYRVIQESLTNIGKYAKANNVEISLILKDYKLSTKIVDDGIGICSEDLQKKDSFGLLGMRERLAQIGSELFISGEKEKGTTLSFIIDC